MPKKDTSNHYVDKKKFYEAMCQFKEDNYERVEVEGKRPIIPPYVAQAIMLISERAARQRKFASSVHNKYREEMVLDAVENCIKYIWNWDPEHPSKNPFGYFSRFAYFAYLRRIKDEVKKHETRKQLIKNLDVISGFYENGGSLSTSDNADVDSHEIYSELQHRLDEYEMNSLYDPRHEGIKRADIDAKEAAKLAADEEQ